MNTKLKTCCFFGRRTVPEPQTMELKLRGIIKNLIVNNNVGTFLFGSKSKFDDLCLDVVTELKEKYPHIRRIYVRAEYPHITDDYKAYLLESYEDTYFPENILGAGKAAYIERNYEMIRKSDFCVVFYDKNYLPPRRKLSSKALTDYQPQSGTKIAYNYAEKKQKNIILV